MDRNFGTMQIVIIVMESLSARRAWIEMAKVNSMLTLIQVALRKESVDRNLALAMSSQEILWSLSARRAWIEI